MQVVCSVDEGKPEEVLIEKAAADKNTLIIMATRGRSGFERWLLGSVAERVAHGAVNDMFLVRAA
jgi:nucleotide-binding universal stress UspA family protein